MQDDNEERERLCIPCQELEFFHVVEHGTPKEWSAQPMQASRRFFTLPVKEENACQGKVYPCLRISWPNWTTSFARNAKALTRFRWLTSRRFWIAATSIRWRRRYVGHCRTLASCM
ncbi:hypothetical protein EB231_32785 [Mesorhizobium sp. NZP2298]|nr:hypothetical protein EB231_32785 [Mesorhizobium sp. NZP2298]